MPCQLRRHPRRLLGGRDLPSTRRKERERREANRGIQWLTLWTPSLSAWFYCGFNCGQHGIPSGIIRGDFTLLRDYVIALSSLQLHFSRLEARGPRVTPRHAAIPPLPPPRRERPLALSSLRSVGQEISRFVIKRNCITAREYAFTPCAFFFLSFPTCLTLFRGRDPSRLISGNFTNDVIRG